MGFTFLGYRPVVVVRTGVSTTMQHLSLIEQIKNQLCQLTVQEMCDLVIAIMYELQYRDDMVRVNAAGEVVPEVVPGGEMIDSD